MGAGAWVILANYFIFSLIFIFILLQFQVPPPGFGLPELQPTPLFHLQKYHPPPHFSITPLPPLINNNNVHHGIYQFTI
jgi:hypothetical protein